MTAIGRLGVLGGGAWGTALAEVAARAGTAARIWARNPTVAAAIAVDHENPAHLPGVALDLAIGADSDLAAVVGWAEALLLVTPAQSLRELAGRLAPQLASGTPLVICCKGIERGTGLLPDELLGELLPRQPLLVLSGPSFAGEVARGLPTAVTLAGRDAGVAARLATALGSPRFRPYLSDDPTGAAVGGATKNVVAIACGIVAGRTLGENARAALITRGLAEISRLGIALGGRRETFMGLSGLGDLTLSCTSPTSRNYALGLALGEGEALDRALARLGTVEGVHTAAALVTLAARFGVELPIAAAVDAVVNRGADIDATIADLLARPVGSEFIWST